MLKKRLLFSVILLSSILLISFGSISAQSFSLKILAKSPGDLGLNIATAQTWPVSSGLKVVPKGSKVYLMADTAGAGVTYSWSITTKPAASAAALDSTGTRGNSFTVDSTGSYTVSVTAGGKTLTQTIFVSTFRGISLNKDCAPCHQTPRTQGKFTQWRASSHATMYKRGITGQLTFRGASGTYGTFCAKCHTTGWSPAINNGNFGYRSRVTGWDTAWYKPGTLSADSLIRITPGDSSRWVRLQTQFPTVEPVANIGCEPCHGPANDHATTADPTKVDVSQEGGVCQQCHDSPPTYTTGDLWAKSNHATLPLSGAETARTSCFPCHRGPAFVKFAKNKTNPGYNLAEDNISTISCQSCHDPHGNSNPSSVRLATLDSLANGYKPTSNPAYKGGSGAMCMNCHRARENSFVKVTNQQKRFADRFYPHYSPQADNFLGANAYEFDLQITGTGTHTFMEDACVTCHMAPDPDTLANPGGQLNHYMKMRDDKGKERVFVCQPCHGTITSFADVKAKSDYDGDGAIEGSQIEIQGLLDKLKAILPKDTTGEVVTMARDSAAVKSHPAYPRILPAMFNYHFVKNDWSKGVHNTTYAVAILQRSLSQVTGVERKDQAVPAAYALEQNYPNPFNPATTISFSLPENAEITLTVYDAAGREVTTLHRGYLTAGNYKVTWNAGNAASGIYYYRITSQNYSMVRKMVFLK